MGFRVVDRLTQKLGCRLRKPFWRRYFLGSSVVKGSEIFLAKPLTYMNHSGQALDSLFAATGCALSDLLVVCDTLDLPVGSWRLKSRGSSAGHNGLGSVIASTGSNNFKRLYIGIGRPENGGIVDYVLGVPTETENARLTAAVERACDTVLDLLSWPIERVMNETNQRKT